MHACTRSRDAVKTRLITTATVLATLGSYIKPRRGGHSYIIHPKRARSSRNVPRLPPFAACNKNKMTPRPHGVMTSPCHLHKALRGWTRAMPNKSLWFMRALRSRAGGQRDIRGRWIRSGEFRLLIGTFSRMLYPYQSLSPILHRMGHERIILTYIWSDIPGDLATGLKDSRGKEKKIRSRGTGKPERPKRDKSRRKFVRNYDFRWMGAKSVSFLRNIEGADGKVVIEVLDTSFLSKISHGTSLKSLCI